MKYSKLFDIRRGQSNVLHEVKRFYLKVMFVGKATFFPQSNELNVS